MVRPRPPVTLSAASAVAVYCAALSCEINSLSPGFLFGAHPGRTSTGNVPVGADYYGSPGDCRGRAEEAAKSRGPASSAVWRQPPKARLNT